LKKVFITGSSRGIGREIALSLFRLTDYEIIVHGSSSRVPDFVKLDNRFSYFSFDLAEFNHIDKLSEFIISEGVDIFINNAGVYTSSDPANILLINYVSPILIMDKIIPHLEQKGGSIININSLAGIYPNAKESKYCSTKFGLDGYIKSLQSDPSSNIQTTQYYLGATKTDMTLGRPNYENLIDPIEFAETLVEDLNNTTFTTISKTIKRKNNIYQ
jgi:3-oxoacyl-[acyl-carrier protein] reductase